MSQPIIENVRDGANEAWDATGNIASSAKHSLLDRLEQVARVARVVRAFGLDDLLLRVGLQRRRSPLVVGGAFGAGVLVGAGLALAVVPAAGLDVRGALSRLMRRVSKEEASLGDPPSVDTSTVAHGAAPAGVRHEGSRYAGPLRTAEVDPPKKGTRDGARTTG